MVGAGRRGEVHTTRVSGRGPAVVGAFELGRSEGSVAVPTDLSWWLSSEHPADVPAVGTDRTVMYRRAGTAEGHNLSQTAASHCRD